MQEADTCRHVERGTRCQAGSPDASLQTIILKERCVLTLTFLSTF